jgi:hypothetical protein
MTLWRTLIPLIPVCLYFFTTNTAAVVASSMAVTLVHFQANCPICWYGMSVMTYAAAEVGIVVRLASNSELDEMRRGINFLSFIILAHLVPFLVSNDKRVVIAVAYVGAIVNSLAYIIDMQAEWLFAVFLALFSIVPQAKNLGDAGYLMSYLAVIMSVASRSFFFPSNGCGEGGTVII